MINRRRTSSSRVCLWKALHAGGHDLWSPPEHEAHNEMLKKGLRKSLHQESKQRAA